MIKTLFLPVTQKFSQTDFFFMQAQGTLGDQQEKLAKERHAAEEELDRCLQAGFQILHSGSVEDSSGFFVSFILHLPNA